MRLLTWLGGVRDPDGSTPSDLRSTFRAQSRGAEGRGRLQMIVWDPERIILAHGRWYDRDGCAELATAHSAG